MTVKRPDVRRCEEHRACLLLPVVVKRAIVWTHISKQDKALASHKWVLKGRANCRYVARTVHSCGKFTTTKLHREVPLSVPLKNGEVVDHINGCRLDNRRCNLRAASLALNGRNRHNKQRNRSGERCIFYREKSKRFQVAIRIDGTQRYLGSFATLSAAVRVRDAAIAKHFPELL